MDQLHYIEAHYGRPVIDKSLASLSVPHREQLEGLLPISWVDASAVQALKTAIANAVGIDPLVFNRQVVRGAIGKTLHSVWRSLLRQLWDGAIIKRTPILYSKAFDRGSMSLRISGSQTATFELVGWPEIPEFDCVGLSAGIEALLEFSGRTGASATWRRNGNRTLFEATWRGRAG